MLISPLYMKSTSTLMSENLTSRMMTIGCFSSCCDKIVSKYVLHADRTTCGQKNKKYVFLKKTVSIKSLSLVTLDRFANWVRFQPHALFFPPLFFFSQICFKSDVLFIFFLSVAYAFFSSRTSL